MANQENGCRKTSKLVIIIKIIQQFKHFSVKWYIRIRIKFLMRFKKLSELKASLRNFHRPEQKDKDGKYKRRILKRIRKSEVRGLAA